MKYTLADARVGGNAFASGFRPGPRGFQRQLKEDGERSMYVWKMQSFAGSFAPVAVLAAALAGMVSQPVQAQGPKQATPMPWMNGSLPPDERAEMVLQQMTQAEKIQLVHGIGWGVLRTGDPVPPEDNGGAGFVPGIKRLGIPDLNLADSAVGVRMAALRGRYSTLLPSTLGAASSWDTCARRGTTCRSAAV
jgi:beta-glucosidase